MKPGSTEPKPAMGQRQYLTVLFTDLCGSTELGRQLEMEDYAVLLARVRALWHEAALAHRGLVLRTQGDGAVMVFGHPEATELDGLHAARAALQIEQGLAHLSVKGLPLSSPLQARSGLHAGVMFVMAGDLERGQLDLVGNVANTAAKLEKAAQPGQILATRAALGPNLGLLQWQALAGVSTDSAEDGGVVAVLGQSSLKRRFDATTQRGLTPLVGRDAVLQQLRRFVHAPANAQAPRSATITAAAGLGKTRLLEELALAVQPELTLTLRGSCERTLDSEVLQPFAQMLRALLNRGAAEPAAWTSTDPSLQPSLAKALQSASVDLYRDLFSQLCAQASVLMVLDDWQWADDASRRLLQALRSLPQGQAPRLLLATREPLPDGLGNTDQAASGAHDPFSLQLLPLDEEQTQQMVQRWLPDADPFLARRIHGYAGGVPLFIEELCHSASVDRLFQSLEEQSAARRSWVAALVVARLARLDRRSALLVQTAAVIGQEVPLALLGGTDGVAVESTELAALADADFLYPEAPTGEATVRRLRFKHGITREAVYETIGLAQRRQLHQNVLCALQQAAASSGQALNSEQAAHHSWGAGMWPMAAEQAELAGDKSASAFAMDRARQHYRMALEALERSTPEQPAAEPVLVREHGLQACRVAAKLGMACVFDPLSLGNDTGNFERAVQRARQLGDASAEARALYWLGYIQYAMGRYHEARDHVRKALTMSQGLGDAPLASQIEATLGQILAGTCDYDEALVYMERAVAAKRQRSRPGSSVAIGSAYTLSCMGSVWADRGDSSAANAAFDEALQLLGNTTHPVGNSVRNWITVARIWQGDWDVAERVAQESVQIAENTQALLLLAVSRSTLGYARWRRDGDAASLQLLQDAVGWMAARQGRMFTSLHFAWLAEASAAVGRVAQARQLSAHVMRRARHGERLGEAIACRAMARVAAAQGQTLAATRWLARAMASATRRQSSREAALNEALKRQLQAQSQVELQ